MRSLHILMSATLALEAMRESVEVVQVLEPAELAGPQVELVHCRGREPAELEDQQVESECDRVLVPGGRASVPVAWVDLPAVSGYVLALARAERA